MFEEDYFRRESVYRKFQDTQEAINALSSYYFDFYCFLKKKHLSYMKPGARVLDIGCGYSGLLNHLLRGGFSYTGVDISHFMISELRKLYQGVEFIEQDMRCPLPDVSPFTFVVALEVLEHVPNPVVAVKNVYDLLVPGGTFLATVPNPKSKIPFTDWRRDKTHVSIMPQTEWRVVFKKAGFDKVESNTIFTLPFLWHFSRIFSKVFFLPEFGASIVISGTKEKIC